MGYWEVSPGCGLGGVTASGEDAAGITVPVEFLVRWDDERVPRDQCLALFDVLGSAEKTLQARPGLHADLPSFEQETTPAFLARRLT